jgi:pimeloyl-ACP methyl ester carboxylesterase
MSGDDPMPDEIPEGAVAAAGFILTEESVLALHRLEVTTLPAAPAPRVLVVPRDDLPDDGKVVAALTAMRVPVTVRPLRGYHDMMKDAHATAVPAEAIAGIVSWLGEVPAAALEPHPAATGQMLRGVASSAGLMGVELPGRPAPIQERPFRAHGGRLFGILSEPEAGAPASRPAVILTNPGAVHRVGSNRMYVELARALAERGFRVLRLDLGGLGDSPAFPGMEENQTYSSRAVADVGEAAAALRADSGHQRVIVGGLCSGAHTAFHAGLERDDVAGLVMLNPIVFYWKPSDALDVAAWMTYQRVSRYKQNISRPDAWKRLAGGQVDVVQVAQTLLQRGRDHLRSRASALVRDVREALRGDEGGENPPRDIGRMCARGTDVLLLFSEGDPGLDSLRLNHWRAVRRLQRRPGFTLSVIPHPGHTFTKIAAQRAVLATVIRHVTARFA